MFADCFMPESDWVQHSSVGSGSVKYLLIIYYTIEQNIATLAI